MSSASSRGGFSRRGTRGPCLLYPITKSGESLHGESSSRACRSRAAERAARWAGARHETPHGGQSRPGPCVPRPAGSRELTGAGVRVGSRRIEIEFHDETELAEIVEALEARHLPRNLAGPTRVSTSVNELESLEALRSDQGMCEVILRMGRWRGKESCMPSSTALRTTPSSAPIRRPGSASSPTMYPASWPSRRISPRRYNPRPRAISSVG